MSSRIVLCSLAAMFLAGDPPLLAQATPPQPGRILTLNEALALAEAQSEQVAMARAGITRAAGGELLVRSERRPQLSGSVSYDRALASEFSGLFDNADGFGSGEGFDDLPFGRANTYRLNLSFSQSLYTGGRLAAQERQAQLASANASLGLKTTRAQLTFDVARAFYDAALADRFVAIAEATLAQAGQAFEQTRAQREAGRVSEFELLRSQVARDTLQPQVIRQRANRDVAYMRLRQLLDLPAEAVQLAANLDDDPLPPEALFAVPLARAEVAGAGRAAIDEARLLVQIREAAVDVVRAQRKPTFSVTSAYGNVAYPTWFPTGDIRTNWTVSVGGSVPLFTGGRIAAQETVARADVDEGRAQLQLTQELALLDAESARRDLTAATAAWEATGGTIQQAQRAYEIAELRFSEGVGTQLELSDARLLLQQALANRVQAARDLQVSRARLALLPDLPFTISGVPQR